MLVRLLHFLGKGKAMLFRVWTEDMNREGIESIVGKEFDGFSLVNAKGYWKGIGESSLVIEVETSQSELPRIRSIAEQIKLTNSQESVMIQALQTESIFV